MTDAIYLVGDKPHRLCDCNPYNGECPKGVKRTLATADLSRCLIPAPDVMMALTPQSERTATTNAAPQVPATATSGTEGESAAYGGEVASQRPVDTPDGAATSNDKLDEQSDRECGLYEKFFVERTDGRSAPGQKHDGCEYYVLDLDHDKHAAVALEAYAASCEGEYPALAADLRAKALTVREEHGLSLQSAVVASGRAAPTGYKLLKDSTLDERSWKEDASHENGNYYCNCCVCDRRFVGHKRRGLCKVCEAEEANPPVAQSASEALSDVERRGYSPNNGRSMMGEQTKARATEYTTHSLIDEIADFVQDVVRHLDEKAPGNERVIEALNLVAGSIGVMKLRIPNASIPSDQQHDR